LITHNQLIIIIDCCFKFGYCPTLSVLYLYQFSQWIQVKPLLKYVSVWTKNAFSHSCFLPLWTGFTVVGMLYFMRVILVNCVEIVLQNTYFMLLLPFTTEDWNQTKYTMNSQDHFTYFVDVNRGRQWMRRCNSIRYFICSQYWSWNNSVSIRSEASIIFSVI
jgi:hypothetical protein